MWRSSRTEVNTGTRSSYGHRISVFMGDCYQLSLSFDVKLQGSRLRWSRTMTRDTDEAGALRFAKKWNIAMPNAGNNRPA